MEGWEIPNAPTSIPNLKSARSAAASDLVNAQVESVNIVGYQTVPLTQNGFTATCATFAPIGMTDGTMTLGDITANENFESFVDSIVIFDANGYVDVQATYVSQATLESWDMWPDYEAGWYDSADEELAGGTLNDTVLPYGTSMTVFATKAGAALLYAGEVIQSNVTLPLVQNGFTAIGNASPVDLTLGDIVANENFESFVDSIVIFDANGYVDIQATYVSQATLEGWDMWPDYEAGWYDSADEELAGGTLNGTVIPAGQGMTVFTTKSGAAITIPNPMSAPAP